MVTIAWNIWKIRNEFVFRLDPIIPEKTVRKAIRGFSELRAPQLIYMDNLSVEDFPSQWKAPDHGRLKLNCDVAIRRNGQEAACASVVRDWAGRLIDGSVLVTKVSSPLQGELVAIRRACGMARALGMTGAIIGSDNQVAIKLECL